MRASAVLVAWVVLVSARSQTTARPAWRGGWEWRMDKGSEAGLDRIADCARDLGLNPPRDARSAERVRAELGIIRESGAQAVQMAELGHLVRAPEVARAVAQALGGNPAAFGDADPHAPLVVSDFEDGSGGWVTNDAVKHSGKTKDTPLVSVRVTEVAHSGRGALEVSFHPGEGWAGAYVHVAQAGERWAAAGVDELSLWLRGDGSGKQVKIDLQAWTDDLKPTFFGVPVSLKDTEWHEVVVPLAELQASNPQHALRLDALISLQVDGSGEIGPATVWIDDITVRNARGEGARFASSPLDDRVAALPPVKAIPRLGTWGLPPPNEAALKQCKLIGLGFGSQGEGRLRQQQLFLEGIASNHTPGRPQPEEVLAGLGLTDEDFDQDAQGRRTGEGVESAVFLPDVVDRYCGWMAERVAARRDAPWVTSFMLSSPISMYGEVHYSASSAGQYAAFSRPAKANFRTWLKREYGGNLAVLSQAWGQQLTTWEEVVPPEMLQAGPEGIDTRTAWSDFMHWYNWWLEEVTRRELIAARREIEKPLAVMMGGPKVGLSQGIALGNVGPIVRLLGQVRPAFLNDTDAQTLFSCRYTRAACSQYGVELMLENVGPPYLQVFHQYNMVLNVLACGGDMAHLAHWGELYDPSTWFGRTWAGLAPLLQRYRTGYVRSDAALFHSCMTSWYRADRSNGDAVRLYDSTNTLWYPDRGYPSWGRALGSPDVVDDVMVEDGALSGRKLLVIPNSSVTVTSRKAVNALRQWVEAGGTVVGFGQGCLAYTVEPDRSLKPTPGMAGLVLPERVRELAETAPTHSGPAFVEQQVGRGRAVLFLTPADPTQDVTHERPFTEEAMQLLAREARRAGVRTWCRGDADYRTNVMYAGRDRNSGKHLFVADFTRYVRNDLPDAIFEIDCTLRPTFDPSLEGEAELVGITDSFASCQGGEAQFDPAAHTLIVRFRLPGTLSLTFGEGRSGLALAKHSLLLWQGDDLVLRPVGAYGDPQTQQPVRIGSDGSLDPEAASVITLVHGDLHRPRFGGGPSFRLDLPGPGTVLLHVNSVAKLGAALVVAVDGREVLRQDLPDKDGENNQYAREYDQDFTVELAAGEHEVGIGNTGGDWFSVDRYVFRGLR